MSCGCIKAERQKAARGELRVPLPAGLAYGRDGRIRFDPDEEVSPGSAICSPSFSCAAPRDSPFFKRPTFLRAISARWRRPIAA